MNMKLKDEMEFELRFIKKCFDKILKDNSDYRTKFYRKNGVPILSIIETLDEEPEIEIYISYAKNKYNADDYIVNIDFPYSYNKKEIKISYAEIDNIPDLCKKLAEDNLKIDKINESIQLLENEGYVVERQYPEGIRLKWYKERIEKQINNLKKPLNYHGLKLEDVKWEEIPLDFWLDNMDSKGMTDWLLADIIMRHKEWLKKVPMNPRDVWWND